MKKILAITAAAAMIAGTAVYASAHCGGGRGINYIDANGDGVCDYCGNTGCGGHGRYYIDADGDGVCDNYGTGAGCRGGGHHGGGRRR